MSKTFKTVEDFCPDCEDIKMIHYIHDYYGVHRKCDYCKTEFENSKDEELEEYLDEKDKQIEKLKEKLAEILRIIEYNIEGGNNDCLEWVMSDLKRIKQIIKGE